MRNNQLFGLRAETSIHAGTGESDGNIDLPIMREQHSGWPVVFGSAVKGALRAAAEQALQHDTETLLTLFGPDTQNASDHAGALMISDARLLALPVRSLTSQYRLVTCPELIKRLARDAERLGFSTLELGALHEPDDENILTAQDEKHDYLFLEEYAYQRQTADLGLLISVLAELSGLDERDITAKLAVVSNDSFAHLCQSAIPVQAHIAIDNDTKTVARGALWHEESLPPDTLLYIGINAAKSRRESSPMTAQDVMTALTDQVFGQFPYLQLGGNETTGMGWCKINAFSKG
ncbi:type III-B CRISPR module RAMP protein Cmr4 [Marinobacterium aestuarii]|uniref:Type III-B CRISPR module RAMP protein Cmr4 n=1 Tax=Marinobacterium aestuarii TaxID=1821621 RepID=A0A1A9EX27_9GAMM|nr:type III-B CRISPR module RAMP protein Cmr4 [Marinobacterium aestuarii]ANG62218.1 type III-B CRISPR module RAMP protein Cmr4 [Marinobacterium aestuarii]